MKIREKKYFSRCMECISNGEQQSMGGSFQFKKHWNGFDLKCSCEKRSVSISEKINPLVEEEENLLT